MTSTIARGVTDMRLNSLLLVEERLVEAAFWTDEMRSAQSEVFGYQLNAFLSSARSVTFLLQKEFATVPGFAEWWEERRIEIRQDGAARFFLEMRNHSQKQGRVAIAGSSYDTASGTVRINCFAGTSEPIPESLRYRNVADCCREHVGKLASLILRTAEAFPFHSCPRRALTAGGIKALGIKLEDIESALGLPVGFAAMHPLEESLRLLSKQVDGVDFETIELLARSIPPEEETPIDRFLKHLVDQIEARRHQHIEGDPFIEAIGMELLERDLGVGKQ